jgi:serine/threonine-protein kinase
MREPVTRRPTSPAVGDVVDGRYRIEEVHAVGGMSTVYRATHLLLARQVALKIVSAEVLGLPGAAARFLREARAVTHLESDHVIRVFDVGVLENGSPFLVMEWLEGEDLYQWMRDEGPLPIDVAVDMVLQACEALAEVHGRGIVHRDLKPSNLFVVRSPEGARHVKLLDFGVSKIAISGTGTRITRNGTVLGSPSYMSPEQMGEAEDADERTDVWGLGVVLFEILTGKLPFEGECLTDILGAILLRPTPSARALRSDVPRALDAAIARCLKADADERTTDVGTLASEIAPFGPEGSSERAAKIAALRTSARLHPIEADVAAVDEELWSAVAQRERGAEALGSGASVMPFITPVASAERLELSDERGRGWNPTRTLRAESKRTRSRAMLIALCVIGIGIGVPAVTGHFSRASELWRSDDQGAQPPAPPNRPPAAEHTSTAAPLPTPSPPPPPPTALAALRTLQSAALAPAGPSRWSDIPDVKGQRALRASPASNLAPPPNAPPDRSPRRAPWISPPAPSTSDSPNKILDSLFEERK